ncbi:UNVERIFIED_CONTAM: hypothetical protein K2H54_010864 [Gekko kuhli]
MGGGAGALPRPRLLPFGAPRGDRALPDGDDESSEALSLAGPLPFYETRFSQLYVGTNGIISTQDFPRETQYVDDDFPTDFPAIAPFLADIDTSGGRGKIYYREDDSREVLDQAARLIWAGFPDAADFVPRHAFVATWENVGAYEEVTRNSEPSTQSAKRQWGKSWVPILALTWKLAGEPGASPSHASRGSSAHTGAVGQRNTFQVVLAYTDSEAYAVFLYPDDGLQFFGTRPKESYNVNLELPARVGFSRGDFQKREGPYYSATSTEQSVKNLYQ